MALCFAAGSASAAGNGASPWADTEQSQVRLISAGAASGGPDELMLGLQVRLEPGWKFYWRSPGDAGIPPQFDWSGSDNLSEVEVLWPAPKRTRLFDLDTFIYEREVVLPIRAKVDDGDRPVRVDLALYYALCREICIPVEAKMAMTLDPGAGPSSAFGSLLDRFLARVPLREGGDLSVVGARVEQAGERQTLEVTVRAEPPFDAPDLLVEGPEGYYFGAPEVRLAADRREAVFRMTLEGPAVPRAQGVEIVATLIDGPRAVERRITTQAR